MVGTEWDKPEEIFQVAMPTIYDDTVDNESMTVVDLV